MSLRHEKSVTRTVRSGLESDTQHGAVVPPLHLSSNFTFEGFDQKRAYDYSRSGNPTRDVLARALADLENGEGAVVTSSGMSAITLVLQLLSPGPDQDLPAGSGHCIAWVILQPYRKRPECPGCQQRLNGLAVLRGLRKNFLGTFAAGPDSHPD